MLHHNFKYTPLYLLLIVSVLGFSSQKATACDVCGCSVGGNYFGILPQFQQHFIGTRYQYRTFQSEHLTLFPGEIPLKTKETFHTTEIWGRFVPHPKFHLFAFIPYNYYVKDEKDMHTVVSGLGDISFMIHYVVFNSGDIVDKKWKQALQIGGGLKIPTGKSDWVQHEKSMLIPSLQAGTGSFDIPLSAIYTIRTGKWGANLEASYRINTLNPRGYKFGDRSVTSLRTFYWYGNSAFTILPHISLSYEYGFKDLEQEETQPYTGSELFLGGVGFDIYRNRFMLQVSTMSPLHQYIAQGQITARQRWNLGLAYQL